MDPCLHDVSRKEKTPTRVGNEPTTPSFYRLSGEARQEQIMGISSSYISDVSSTLHSE